MTNDEGTCKDWMGLSLKQRQHQDQQGGDTQLWHSGKKEGRKGQIKEEFLTQSLLKPYEAMQVLWGGQAEGEKEAVEGVGEPNGQTTGVGARQQITSQLQLNHNKPWRWFQGPGWVLTADLSPVRRGPSAVQGGANQDPAHFSVTRSCHCCFNNSTAMLHLIYSNNQTKLRSLGLSNYFLFLYQS